MSRHQTLEVIATDVTLARAINHTTRVRSHVNTPEQIYWLCLELFESPLVGWIAIALISVSPFHILYAQEAREYSLWMMTILLSSAALLRAMRLKTKLSWGIYAVTLALGLYTYLFSVLIAIGQGIYVLTVRSFG